MVTGSADDFLIVGGEVARTHVVDDLGGTSLDRIGTWSARGGARRTPGGRTTRSHGRVPWLRRVVVRGRRGSR